MLRALDHPSYEYIDAFLQPSRRVAMRRKTLYAAIAAAMRTILTPEMPRS